MQLSLILKDNFTAHFLKEEKREKVLQQGKICFFFFKLQAWSVTKRTQVTVYLQCTALPWHSLLCPQFEQAPWYHSKKWRSGLLTQRSHCTDLYNQDLPTSNEDSPKKNKRSSANHRQEDKQIAIHMAGGSLSPHSMHHWCSIILSYLSNKLLKWNYIIQTQWLFEAVML